MIMMIIGRKLKTINVNKINDVNHKKKKKFSFNLNLKLFCITKKLIII